MQLQFLNGQMRIEFDNGLTLSAVNGRGSYTDNKLNDKTGFVATDSTVAPTSNVEIAIINSKGHYVLGGNVAGWVTVKELGKVISYLTTFSHATKGEVIHHLDLVEIIK